MKPIENEGYLYYIHFLNLEKRNDRWIKKADIVKNLGQVVAYMEGNKVSHININY